MSRCACAYKKSIPIIKSQHNGLTLRVNQFELEAWPEGKTLLMRFTWVALRQSVFS